MKREDLPDLPDDVRAILEQERGAPEPVPQAVRDDLAQRMAGLFVTGTGVSAGVAGAGASAKAIALFVAGAVVGAGTVVALRPEPRVEVRYVEVERSAERDAGPAFGDAAQPALPSAAPSSLPAPAPSPRSGRASAPSARSADTVLARERAILETARSAVARRDGASALVAIEDHERQFPSGRLSEEREALAVQALVLAGRKDDARARAERFRARYPNGLFLPIVDAAVK